MNSIININEVKRYVDNKTFKLGVNLCSEQDFELKIDHNNDLDFYQVSTSIVDKKQYNVHTNIKYNDKYNVYEIKDSKCNCILSDRCEHVSALLTNISKYSVNEFMLIAQGKKSNQKQNTSKDVLVLEQKILDRYDNNNVESIKYELIPIVVFNKGKIFLEFKIGNKNSHLYSVTNVYDFYQRFETNETYDYSSKFSCIHNFKYIENSIPGLNEFLFAKISNNKKFIDSLSTYNNNGNSKFSYDKRAIEITENDFGILFSYLKDFKMNIKYIKDNKTCEEVVNCEFSDLELKLNIEKKKSYYNLSVINNTVYTFYGNKYIVSLVNNTIKVTTINNNDDARFLNLILKESLKIDIDDFDRIYDNVIKDRLKFIKLSDDCKFNENQIESVKLHIYVDANKSGNLIIKYKLFRKDVEINDTDEELLKRRSVLALHDCLKRFKVRNYYLIKNIDDVFEFYNSTLKTITAISDEIFLSEEFKKVKIISKPSIKTGVRLDNDLLKIDVKIDEKKIKDLSKLIKLYNEKKKYYRLENGDFLLLESDMFKNLQQVIDNINTTKSTVEKDTIVTEKYNALYVDSMLKEFNINNEYDNSYKKFIKSITSIDKVKKVDVKLNNAKLRDYQIEGYNFLKTMQTNNFGVILADDMGLGKTIQLIAVMKSIKGPHIVVCPSSLVYNWLSELNKFAPNLNIGIIKNEREQREKLIKKYKQFDVLVTSYDTLKRDIELYNEIDFEIVIIDEAQYIKNPNTKGAKVVKKLNGKYRFALTGTPIENNLTELWSIFDFVLPGYLSTYYQFHKNFEIPIVKENNLEILDNLNMLVKPFILRRMKADVLKELPEKMESVVYCDFEEEQKNLYDAQLLKITNEIENDENFESNKISFLSMLMRLRQICCDPKLIYDDKTIKSSKLDLAIDLINNSIESNRKVLLFSQFTSMLDIISSKLTDLNIKHHLLTGSISSKKRMEMVDSFNNDDSCVFLISLKAGGTGLNLTTADVVIHYDPWWNLSSEKQATDRVYRIGQQNKVNVYKLIAKDTIEEKIIDIQNSKEELSNSILNNNDNPFAALNKKEFLKLLK